MSRMGLTRKTYSVFVTVAFSVVVTVAVTVSGLQSGEQSANQFYAYDLQRRNYAGSGTS